MVAVLLVVLTTGVLINHTDHLRLAEIRLTHPALMSWYGLDDSQMDLQGFQAEDDLWVSAADDRLYVNLDATSECLQPLRGALLFQELLLALCSDQLLLLDQSGNLLEKVTQDLGLPTAINRLGVSGKDLIMDIPSGHVVFDTTSLTTRSMLTGETRWATEKPLPSEIASEIDQTSIPLEKLVLDIHSGRILGSVGIWLVDLSALLLLLLTITGLWSWLRHEKLTSGKKSP